MKLTGPAASGTIARYVCGWFSSYFPAQDRPGLLT
jgi:hypothetical protein